MKDQSDLKFRNTLEDIRLHFNFLFKRGFRIASILFTNQDNENWQITLTANNCLIDIYGEQGMINLALSMMQHHDSKLFDLEYIAQFVGNGKGFSYKPDKFPTSEAQQLQKIAGFLESHFTEILAQVEKENLPTISTILKKSPIQKKPTLTSKK